MLCTLVKISRNSSSVHRNFYRSFRLSGSATDFLFRGFSSESQISPTRIWLKSPKDLTDHDYNVFYQQMFKDPVNPLAYTHFSDCIRKGEVEFTSILYVATPTIKNVFNQKILLYANSDYVADGSFKEFPAYLPFVKGVVDVAAESLPDDVLRIINRRLIAKTLKLLAGIADDKAFWKMFDRFIVMGCNDIANRDEVASLLRFLSSHSGKHHISLDNYIEKMKPEQKVIYYHHDLSSYRSGLNKLAQKNVEVLFVNFLICLDGNLLKSLKSYKGKIFVDIDDDAVYLTMLGRFIWKGILNLIPEALKGIKKEYFSLNP